MRYDEGGSSFLPHFSVSFMLCRRACLYDNSRLKNSRRGLRVGCSVSRRGILGCVEDNLPFTQSTGLWLRDSMKGEREKERKRKDREREG